MCWSTGQREAYTGLFTQAGHCGDGEAQERHASEGGRGWEIKRTFHYALIRHFLIEGMQAQLNCSLASTSSSKVQNVNSHVNSPLLPSLNSKPTPFFLAIYHLFVLQDVGNP